MFLGSSLIEFVEKPIPEKEFVVAIKKKLPFSLYGD